MSQTCSFQTANLDYGFANPFVLLYISEAFRSFHRGCPQVCLNWMSGMGSGICCNSCCVSVGHKPLWRKTYPEATQSPCLLSSQLYSSSWPHPWLNDSVCEGCFQLSTKQLVYFWSGLVCLLVFFGDIGLIFFNNLYILLVLELSLGFIFRTYSAP